MSVGCLNNITDMRKELQGGFALMFDNSQEL